MISCASTAKARSAGEGAVQDGSGACVLYALKAHMPCRGAEIAVRNKYVQKGSRDATCCNPRQPAHEPAR